MPQREFASYKHSAFFSYAADDDITFNEFVSEFGRQLDKTLAAAIRHMKIRVPSAYMYARDPLVQGNLTVRLRQKVDDSFAMFVFVHNSYLVSNFCLQELQHFKELFGEEGFNERLYIVAMSEGAITSLVTSERWRKLCPHADQIWTDFYDPRDRDCPLPMYACIDGSSAPIMIDPFRKLFTKVRNDLALKIIAAVKRENHAASYPVVTEASRASAQDERVVRMYIEGDKHQVSYWESLGRHIQASWKMVVDSQDVDPPLSLEPTGLTMSQIDSQPPMDDADGVILLWDNKTPDSLAAQIRKVEPKLSGSNFAPGLIAYVNESGVELPSSVKVGNWNVVRFQRASDGRARVVPADALVLGEFLNSVFERKCQRLAQSRSPAGVH